MQQGVGRKLGKPARRCIRSMAVEDDQQAVGEEGEPGIHVRPNSSDIDNL